jgi:hypothetical protein
MATMAESLRAVRSTRATALWWQQRRQFLPHLVRQKASRHQSSSVWKTDYAFVVISTTQSFMALGLCRQPLKHPLVQRHQEQPGSGH